MIGLTLGRYHIVDKIGAGGMGEVYRALDERLDREVAIKVLPPGMLADEDARKRFRKEALALAKLNHPNIATIFDFDTEGGVDFLVTEYIPGIALSDKIASGPCSEKDVARLGVQLSEALSAAHNQQVVHRDLKPGNLRVTPDGRLKVLDFGLAKLLRPALDDDPTRNLTETHAVSGTLPYMPPEQLSGDSPDRRSDIYSAGAVLYEAATGQRPFREQVPSRLTDAILHQPPVAPRAVNGRIVPELERIILKCLEKEPENRYQSANELAVDLRRFAAPVTTVAPESTNLERTNRRRAAVIIGIVAVLVVAGVIAIRYFGWPPRLPGAAPAAEINSLAVLPLENLSRDQEQEYFADGMTDALITDLAQIRSLRVISRTSVMHYKRTQKTMPEIARELHVDAVLEGSVERAGNRVRITAQLVHAPTDRHIWAKTYERDLSDVLALQDEVASTIARQIGASLTSGEQASLARNKAVNPEAYQSYLKGRFALQHRTRIDAEQAINYFEQTIQLDPSYAAAYSGIADAYIALGTIYSPPREVMPKAKAAALKALNLNDSLAEAHASLAVIMTSYEYDQKSAEEEYKRAVELNPGNAEIHMRFGVFFTATGRVDEARAQMKVARDLDPLSPGVATRAVFPSVASRDWVRAIEIYRTVLQTSPNYWYPHLWLGYAYEQNHQLPEAISEFQVARRLDDSGPPVGWLGHAQAISGNRAEAEKALQKLKEISQSRYVCPSLAATIYAGLGDKEKALQGLEKAYEDRSECLWVLPFDPRLDSLRSDPRFQDLLRRTGLPSSPPLLRRGAAAALPTAQDYPTPAASL